MLLFGIPYLLFQKLAFKYAKQRNGHLVKRAHSICGKMTCIQSLTGYYMILDLLLL